MALTPLPTAAMSRDRTKEKSVFPYPEINKSEKGSNVQDEALLSPFLKTKADSKAPVSVVSEEQRMGELENMLSEAQSRAAVIEQEAYDKAYSAGEKSGLALGEKRAEQILETMQSVVEQAELELQSLQQQSVVTVMDIAEAVLEHVMGENDEHIKKVLEHSVHKALDQFVLGFNEGLVLSVNPQDLNMFARMTNLPEGCRLKGVHEVEEGTCQLISAGQDILIDPKVTIQDSLDYVRERLLKNV